MPKPAAVFTALSDPTRRGILESLQNGGQPAGKIAGLFHVSWPAISRHLRILKAAGLVWETRDGRTRYYELNPAALQPALTWLAQFRPNQTRQVSSSAPGPSLIGREYTS
jgi:DNA-binding transcriptional ArsR family regulator